MNIYIYGMIATLTLLCVLNKSLKGGNKSSFYFAIFVVIVWGGIMGARNITVGVDTLNYCNIFTGLANMDFKEIMTYRHFEKGPLYFFYNRIIGIIGDEPQFIIVTNSTVFVVGVVVFLYKNSSHFGMSIFYFLSLHYYFAAMNIARQSIAMMLILWVYHYAVRGEYKKSIITLICAVLIHRTAILGVAILVLCWMKLDLKKVSIIVLSTAIGIGLLAFIVNVFVKLFPIYEAYVDDLNTYTSAGNRVYTAFFLLTLFIMCFIWKVLKKFPVEAEEEYWCLFSISMIAIELMIMLNDNGLFARTEMYFSYFFMLFIPFCIENFFERKSKRVCYLVTVAILMIPFLYKIEAYLPYETWF